MKLEFPIRTVFYRIEETIKEYRKLSQKNISQLVPDMTIDQFLVLTIFDSHPHLSQGEVATLVFKDNASITRMIESMVRKGYLSRKTDENDRRRYKILISGKGKNVIKLLSPTIKKNREIALQHLSKDQIDTLSVLLKKITANCTTFEMQEENKG